MAIVGLQITVARTRSLVPVSPGLRRNGVADIDQRTADLADDMMRAILVASAHHTGNLAVCVRNAVAHFRDPRIHSFENLLRITTRMSHPGLTRSEEHTSELQSTIRNSTALFC